MAEDKIFPDGETNSKGGLPDDQPTTRGLVNGQRVFGRFILDEVVGRGGMGVVWRARDETLRETVALKVLPDEVAQNAVAIDELKEETRRARRLTHPNIVRIYEFMKDELHAAVLMEYVDGATLARLRLDQPGKVFTAQALAPLVDQLCSALDYAHLGGKVVHRDLKPANLLVTRDGQLKITDFGIARSLSETQTRFSGKAECGSSGTLTYMSPQQLNGEKPTTADDIYSVGATLYDLLTGKPPFYYGDVTRQIYEQTPKSISSRRVELGVNVEPVPATWERTILACLDKDPRARPQNASEIIRSLKRTPLPPLTKISKWPTYIGLVVSLLVVGLAAHFWQNRTVKSAPALSYAPVEAKNAKAETVSGPRENRASDTKATGLAQSFALPAAPAPKLESPSSTSDSNRIAVVQSEHHGAKSIKNSLGIDLLEIGIGRWMSSTLIRRADYSVFVFATNTRPGNKVISIGAEGWQEFEGSWQKPGFAQGEDDPVVGISWEEAKAFCQWLSETEAKNGRISGDQHYQLPSENDWNSALLPDGGRYPWGNQWPPPTLAGNYAGEEVAHVAYPWPEGWSLIESYSDPYARTSPVNSFRPNSKGFYDLSGNVLQWCEDLYSSDSVNHVLRGSSWADYQSSHLSSDSRQGDAPDFRATNIGFRIVLVSDPGSKQN